MDKNGRPVPRGEVGEADSKRPRSNRRVIIATLKPPVKVLKMVGCSPGVWTSG